MNDRGAGIAPPPGAKPLANLDRDVAAQVLLLIQGRAQTWVEEGRIATRWGPSVAAATPGIRDREKTNILHGGRAGNICPPDSATPGADCRPFGDGQGSRT